MTHLDTKVVDLIGNQEGVPTMTPNLGFLLEAVHPEIDVASLSYDEAISRIGETTAVQLLSACEKIEVKSRRLDDAMHWIRTEVLKI